MANFERIDCAIRAVSGADIEIADVGVVEPVRGKVDFALSTTVVVD